MQKLDRSTWVTDKWKNGRGTTTEAWVTPRGADWESFDARVSVARVEEPGPFSDLPGVDRTLVVTSGSGLKLDTADGSALTLRPLDAPFSFTGDDAVLSSLIGGPVTDLNVMTRRRVMTHKVSRARVEAERSVTCPGEVTLLCVLSGHVAAEDDTQMVDLTEGDILAISPTEGLVVVRPGDDGAAEAPHVLLVDLFRR
jgi:uncharacterized protein